MHDKPVALVTRANYGIGLQISKDLAACGLTVLIESRSRERGESVVKEVGQGAFAFHLDVTDQLRSHLRQSASGTSLAASTCPSRTRPSRIRKSSPVSPLRTTQRRRV
ncbi:SDR family NAD(P)-dependent oxidoreductase [Paraburkholderia hospita]|uniref:SDR family NAD(P)-dependent oxidoreductase n=1 Tax=Paraburkholderia hospita TaxID=169430 RepID=UPI003ECE0197